ncbi:hypothetical protein B5K10_32930 [Rhizobium leguminosarum bv. trifolii]|uniref:Uncharacterized protein n=2 Tax=Rhizobium TaxID=379 RepID=A0A3E1AXP5_RHILT|nr:MULTISPECIES: hypothetical protein [Rhizobium]KPH04498.1 hypothetical protein AOG23_32905 [Rhizobium acidisoli]QAS81184.1 hypothetical protein CO657_25075 [Rhizobium acidisoli]RFB81671.1 hypothetical protein B5K10_32930 [Rhizobium leguminosarum bv. trifolii]
MPFDLKELDLRSAQSLRRRIRALAYAGKVNCEAFVPRWRQGAVLATSDRISIRVSAAYQNFSMLPADPVAAGNEAGAGHGV